MHAWMNEWMNECMNAWMNECMNAWMNEWMHEWMSEWMNEWVSEWMSGLMIERMNEWMNEVRAYPAPFLAEKATFGYLEGTNTQESPWFPSDFRGFPRLLKGPEGSWRVVKKRVLKRGENASCVTGSGLVRSGRGGVYNIYSCRAIWVSKLG